MMNAKIEYSEDVSPNDDVDMDESIIIAQKEDAEKLLKEADAEAIGTFEERKQQPTYPTAGMGRCGRCSHVGPKDSICFNCVSYYTITIDYLSDGTEESETDSQIAEQLANEFCGSPVKASPEDIDVDDDDDDDGED
jgi:hypothetical protein